MSLKETLKQRTKTKTTKTDIDDKDNDVGDNIGDQPYKPGFCGTVVDIDQGLTSMFAVCATSQSSAGHMRPFMIVLEYSCHGVPWLVSIPIWILVSHSMLLHQKLINLYLCRLFECFSYRVKPTSVLSVSI